MEKYKDKQWLQEHMKNNTVSEIAKEIGCGEITIYRWIDKLGLKKTPPKYKDSQWLMSKLKIYDAEEIARQEGVSSATIRRWAKRFRLNSNDKLVNDRQWVEEQLKIHKGSLTEICKEYGINRYTIDEHCRKWGLTASVRKRRYALNENYFHDIDNEEKAYFLGLLMADGYVTRNLNTVTITLQEGDVSVLRKLADVLNYQRNLSYRNNEDKKSTYSISISSKRICQDLVYHGVSPKKSGKEILPETIPSKLIKHFIRGFMDGDGHLSYIRSNEFTLCSKSINILYSIRDYLEDVLSIPHKEILIWTNKNTNHKLFYYKLFSQNAYLTCEHLYNEATIYLPRKYEIYSKMSCPMSQKCGNEKST